MSSESGTYVLSFGGGVNTVALMILLLNERAPVDQVVFADTGGELPETYETLVRAESYLAERGVPLITVAARPGGRTLYETALRRRVIPSVKWRWSTRDYKVTPIHRHYRALGTHIFQYIGIAYDEIHRMKDSRVEFITNLYPLVDRKLKRQDCVDIIQNEGFPVPPKSGCFFCPFNSLERWHWLHEQHPELYEKAIALEENSKHFPNQRLTDQVYRHRASITLRELGSTIQQETVDRLERTNSECSGYCMT